MVTVHTFECPLCGMVSHNPHDAENLYCGACHRSFIIMAPGLVVDDTGTAHLYLAQLLEANGYDNTPANRDALLTAARARLAELGAEIEIVE